MKRVAPLGEITFRECSQRHRRLSLRSLICCLCRDLPQAKRRQPVRETKIADVLALEQNKEIKNACDNRRSFDPSLVARIFRISRNHRCCSRCPRCGPGVTCAAFHERQNSKRLDLYNANSVESYCSVARKRPASNVVSSIPSRTNGISEKTTRWRF